MATSGLIVMARGKEMERRLSIAFQQRQVEKRYVAVVAGHPQPEHGQIALPLITDWPNRPRQKVDHETGKPSLTRYEVAANTPEDGTSRVRLYPTHGPLAPAACTRRPSAIRSWGMSCTHPAHGTRPLPAYCCMRRAWYLPHPVSGSPLELLSPAPFDKAISPRGGRQST